MRDIVVSVAVQIAKVLAAAAIHQTSPTDIDMAAAARSFRNLNSDWNNYVPHASSTLIFK